MTVPELARTKYCLKVSSFLSLKPISLLPFQPGASVPQAAGTGSPHPRYRKAAPQAGAKGSLLADPTAFICLPPSQTKQFALRGRDLRPR